MNGKVMAKFFKRSHFLSILNNVKVKKQISHDTTEKVCHLHYGIFSSYSRCHTCSIFITIFALFPQNSKLWNQKSNGILETATGFEPTAT